MSSKSEVLIVGGGQGGAHAAIQLRQLGFAGSIRIVGAEPDAPYDRPPLSKDYLLGRKAFERMLFRSPEKWREMEIDLLLGEQVDLVEPEARLARTASGLQLGYRRLIWAAGGRPRQLGCPGADLPGVHSIRSRADVDRLLAGLPQAERIVVVGGGYIGLEAAAAFVTLDKSVVVLEALDRVLSRVAGEPLSRFYEAEHRARGVDVRLGAAVECIEAERGRVSAVRLRSGELLPADLVVVAIGIEAVVDPLAVAGAELGDGVRVDPFCRTSLADVFAIGDCAEHRNGFVGDEWIRLESVQNATDQAATVARTIRGIEQPYAAMPWFWSNQYDLRLQTVGISRGHDDLVIRGDPGTRAFSVVYLRQGAVVALDCVNATRDYVQGRLLIAGGMRPDKATLADPDVPLKAIAAAA